MLIFTDVILRKLSITSKMQDSCDVFYNPGAIIASLKSQPSWYHKIHRGPIRECCSWWQYPLKTHMSGCSAAHLLECQKRYGSQSLHHPRNALKFVNEHGILQNCQPDQLPELHKQCDGAIIWIWWVVNNLCMATLSADQELWRQIMHQNQDMWTRWFWMTGPLRGSLYATSKGEDFTTAWVVGTHEWFSALTLTKF